MSSHLAATTFSRSHRIRSCANQVLTPCTIPNGIVWTPQHDFMYWIDTFCGTVDRFKSDSASGDVSDREVAIKIDDKDGYPDGMTMDSDGNLWIAMWGGWSVNQYNPSTGEKMRSIKLPCAQVTSCAFGGDDLNQLFITTASCGLSDQALREQPLAGGLFVFFCKIKRAVIEIASRNEG